MKDSNKNLTEEKIKMEEEMKSLLEEANSNPEVAEKTAPASLRSMVFAEIQAKNVEEKTEETCAKETKTEIDKVEEQELIRLGKLYKKKRKLRKYVVLAAAIIGVLIFGVTSMGGPKKVFEQVKSAFLGREQMHVDSKDGDVAPPTKTEEGEVYQKIEDEFGINPVLICDFPKGVEFLDAEVFGDLQGANLIYGKGDSVKITYFIRPNYRDGSWGEDVEDEFVREYTKDNGYTIVCFKEYAVEGEERRWTVQFAYEDVTYFLRIFDTTETEVYKIVDSLYFQ